MGTSQEIPRSLPSEADTHVQIELAEAGQHADRNSLDIQKLKSIDERVDHEVAEYAGTTRIEIDTATNSRLKRMIDRRVLSVMIVTYFLQALDKGTISFVSIMGFNDDNNLVEQQVRFTLVDYDECLMRSTDWYYLVLVVDYLYLHCNLDCRVPNQSYHPTCTHCQVSLVQYHGMGSGIGVSCGMQELRRAGSGTNYPGHVRSMYSAYFYCSEVSYQGVISSIWPSS